MNLFVVNVNKHLFKNHPLLLVKIIWILFHSPTPHLVVHHLNVHLILSLDFYISFHCSDSAV